MSRFSQHCPHEDDVVLSFVDGEPVDNGATLPLDELAKHLEACPNCARAVDESRKVDALLASKTQTEMAEEEAEELLAFLHAETVPGIASSSRRVAGWSVVLGAAALTAAGWIVSMLLAGSNAADPSGSRGRAAPGVSNAEGDDPVRPEAEPRNGGGVSERVAARPSGFTVPAGGRLPTRRVVSQELDPELLRRAFAGRWVAGISVARLDAAARDLLQSSGRSRRVDRLASPVRLDGGLRFGPIIAAGAPLRRIENVDLVAAAARWLLDERESRTSIDDLRVVGRAVLGASGELRERLVREVRGHREVVQRHVVRRIDERRWRGHADDIALLGALGIDAKARRLAELPMTLLGAAVCEARRTADGQCFAWLVRLYSSVANRSYAHRVLASHWFDDLDEPGRRALRDALDERVQATRRHGERELLRTLGLQLALDTAIASD